MQQYQCYIPKREPGALTGLNTVCGLVLLPCATIPVLYTKKGAWCSCWIEYCLWAYTFTMCNYTSTTIPKKEPGAHTGLNTVCGPRLYFYHVCATITPVLYQETTTPADHEMRDKAGSTAPQKHQHAFWGPYNLATEKHRERPCQQLVGRACCRKRMTNATRAYCAAPYFAVIVLCVYFLPLYSQRGQRFPLQYDNTSN